MEIKQLHDWKMTAKQAISLQGRLARQVRFSPIRKKVRIVAGLDCACSRDKKRIGAVIAVL